MKFKTSVTFESDKNEPVCICGELTATSVDEAARRAVFRALADLPPRTKYESVVVVLDKVGR